MRSSNHEKVLLTSIQSLTFQQNVLTNARRSSAIREQDYLYCALQWMIDQIRLTAQLTCKGRACDLYQPEAIQCINMGDDGSGNVQWKVLYPHYVQHAINLPLISSVIPICHPHCDWVKLRCLVKAGENRAMIMC